jgi:glycosyltransferase involved in cell wall biosynthesis
MNVLFVASAPPLPPFSGGNVNVYHVLQLLAAEVKVHLVLLAPPTVSESGLCAALHEHGIAVARVYAVPQARRITNWHRIRSMCLAEAPGPSFIERTVGAAVRNRIAEALAPSDITLLHVWSPSMAGSLSSLAVRPKIVTFGDSFSLLHLSYSRSKPFPYSVYHSVAARAFEAYEERVLSSYDHAVFFTDRDLRHAERRSTANLSVIPNGATLRRLRATPELAGPPAVVFHGNYAHFPNMQAARFLVLELRRALAERLGERQFVLRLAGQDNGCRLKRLTARASSVDYVGYVEHLDGFLAGAQVYCAPIVSGAGMKNKVLDAFSAGLPVVATPEAVEGLPVRDGEHCLLAQPASFVDAVARVLGDRDLRTRLASGGRAVAETLSWAAAAQSYLALYRDITRHI